jgi:hypothetical protein
MRKVSWVLDAVLGGLLRIAAIAFTPVPAFAHRWRAALRGLPIPVLATALRVAEDVDLVGAGLRQELGDRLIDLRLHVGVAEG